MLKEIFDKEIVEKLSGESCAGSEREGVHVYSIILGLKSDYNIICEFDDKSAQIMTFLKSEKREHNFWEISFSIHDYRNPEYFHEHFIGVAKKLVFSNSRIILSKGLIFVQFQAYSIASEDKIEKISSFYKARWKCKVPFLSSKSASFDGFAVEDAKL